VAQLARTVARALNLNEDLTEAISLGHDLGHTPFGHVGEDVLNELYPGGFHHNQQSLRVVDPMSSNLAAAWRAAHQVTMAFVGAIPEEAFEDRYATRTRTVVSQFMHIQYVRVKNLQTRGGEFLGDLAPFAKGAEPTKAELVAALEASGEALGRLFARIDEVGEVRSWSGAPPSTFLAYHVAHEAHHRALASVALRSGGHKLPSDVTHGLWYTWRKAGDA